MRMNGRNALEPQFNIRILNFKSFPISDPRHKKFENLYSNAKSRKYDAQGLHLNLPTTRTGERDNNNNEKILSGRERNNDSLRANTKYRSYSQLFCYIVFALNVLNYIFVPNITGSVLALNEVYLFLILKNFFFIFPRQH